MQRFLKFATLVPICFATWWCTSTLMAQQGGKAGKPSSAAMSPATVVSNSAGIVTTTATENFVVTPGALATSSGPLIATNSIKFVTVKVADGMATVDAQVVLSERRRTTSYLWRLSLLDAQGGVIDQVLYDHQTFEMEPNGSMQPTFHEVALLMPGATRIQLALLAFQPGTDLNLMKDPEAAQAFTVLRRTTKLQ